MSYVYSNLKTSIALWLANKNLEAAIPDFVRTAEAEFRRDQRLIGMLSSTEVGGNSTGSINVPDDLLQLKELRINGVALTKLPFDEGRKASTGPYFYQSGDTYKLIGDASGDWVMAYDRALQPLVADTDTNWLLTASSDVYLWKCCEIGSVFLQDPQAATGYNTKYSMAVDQMVEARNTEAWGGAPVQVRAPGVV